MGLGRLDNRVGRGLVCVRARIIFCCGRLLWEQQSPRTCFCAFCVLCCMSGNLICAHAVDHCRSRYNRSRSLAYGAAAAARQLDYCTCHCHASTHVARVSCDLINFGIGVWRSRLLPSRVRFLSSRSLSLTLSRGAGLSSSYVRHAPWKHVDDCVAGEAVDR